MNSSCKAGRVYRNGRDARSIDTNFRTVTRNGQTNCGVVPLFVCRDGKRHSGRVLPDEGHPFCLMEFSRC
jgi:hypothetical protein